MPASLWLHCVRRGQRSTNARSLYFTRTFGSKHRSYNLPRTNTGHSNDVVRRQLERNEATSKNMHPKRPFECFFPVSETDTGPNRGGMLPMLANPDYKKKIQELFPQGHKACNTQFLGTQNTQMIPGVTEPGRVEIAFLGRSNTGKSTLINTVLNKQHLCPTSKSPGRTRTINFFRVNNSSLVLVDLPGYGFAKGQSKEIKSAWMQLISGYIFERSGNVPPSKGDLEKVNCVYPRILRRVLLLVDASRGINEFDDELMDMLDEIGATYQLVITKADNLQSSSQRKSLVEMIRVNLSRRDASFPFIVMTSAREKWGIQELKHCMALVLPYDNVVGK